MAQDNKPSKTKQAELKALTQFNQFCQKQANLQRLRTELQQCSDLIIQAKAIALSPLPYRKKNSRQLVRKIKVGEQTALVVTYTSRYMAKTVGWLSNAPLCMGKTVGTSAVVK